MTALSFADTTTAPQTCWWCDVKGFHNWSHFKAHMKVSHPPETRRIACPDCDRVFSHPPAFQQHHRAYHQPYDDRFFSQVHITSGCWTWTGCIDTNGYGQMMVGRKRHLVHKLAYLNMVGPIAPGLELDHLCFNRLCVRPDHLEAVTKRENIRRMHAHTAGSECPHCGLVTNLSNLKRHLRAKHPATAQDTVE